MRRHIAARLARAALAVTLAVAINGCRDPLCEITFVAVCVCDDPLVPELQTCQATADVVTCELDAGVDPCRVNPCCQLAVPHDGRAPDRDGGRDLDGGRTDAGRADGGDAGTADRRGGDGGAGVDAGASAVGDAGGRGDDR